MADDLSMPTLPEGKEWPAHMLGDGPFYERMRATYTRIANAVAADQREAKERRLALEWCRANGNPHLRNASEVSHG